MIAFGLRRGRIRSRLPSSPEGQRRMRLLFVTGALAVLSALVLLVSPPAEVSYQVGQVADRTVKAPHSVRFVSESLTAEARERAADQFPRVFHRDPSVAAQQVTTLNRSLEQIGRARVDSQSSRSARLASVQQELADTADVALDMPAEEWNILLRELPDILRATLSSDIRVEDVDQVRREVPRSIPAAWTQRQRSVASELLQRLVVANTAYDAQATDRGRQQARESTQPIFVQVLAGEVVVTDGTVVTQQVVEKLRALGLSNPGVDWRRALAFVLWSGLVAAMFTLYLQRFQPEAWSDGRRIGLAAAALLLMVAAGRALVPGHAVLPYFIPFAAVGMTLAILIGGRTALATQTAAALHLGLMSERVELLAYVLLPALLGMTAVRRATTARDFLAGIAFVALGNLGVLASFILFAKTADVLGAVQLGAAALTNALLSGALSFGGSIFIGHLARITTVFELRELGDPNHPLLRQLLLRTPGTYHHSLLVANLAERAAEVVGAESLVARVGAYYHDIGKMRNPSAFIENQAGEKNPHDELDPLVSAQIVAAHVRDGLALADRYRLPEAIREVIPGHHGTGVVKYFYQQATAQGGSPDADQYRYPGPRPRSREAGIVMLADGVEASVRSLPAKTQDEIRRMVDKIVGERLAEGQLDECELTLADIQRSKDAFVELLVSVYHERIPYPEDRITELPSTRDAARSS